jgi:sec-independent protein translocase protein TatA
MIGSLGWQELLIILVILALLFGASRVADLGGALGKGIREFRNEARAGDDDEKGGDTTNASTDADSTTSAKSDG